MRAVLGRGFDLLLTTIGWGICEMPATRHAAANAVSPARSRLIASVRFVDQQEDVDAAVRVTVRVTDRRELRLIDRAWRGTKALARQIRVSDTRQRHERLGQPRWIA